MALTKADIVEAVQTEIGYTRRQSTELVETLLQTIKSKLESGERYAKFEYDDRMACVFVDTKDLRLVSPWDCLPSVWIGAGDGGSGCFYCGLGMNGSVQ